MIVVFDSTRGGRIVFYIIVFDISDILFLLSIKFSISFMLSWPLLTWVFVTFHFIFFVRNYALDVFT